LWAWLVGVEALESPASPTRQDVAVANKAVDMLKKYLKTARRANQSWCRKFTDEQVAKVQGLPPMKDASSGGADFMRR
jgi:hypothetical protein